MQWSQKIFYKQIENRAKKIANLLLPYIEDKNNILDFGCGDMKIAEFICQKRKVSITGVDTVDSNLSGNKFIKYDGGNLPFKNKKFDLVLSIFVLHHTDNPEYWLKELNRVSNGKIIIVEDIYNNLLQHFFVCIFDWIGNRIESSKISIPFNFKTDNAWKKIFEKYSLKIKAEKRIYTHLFSYFLVQHRLYVLEKRSA